MTLTATAESRQDEVGGHQASCASISTIMAALYFQALRPRDKVAIKPHAGPVLHAIQYLLGNQSLDQLQVFVALAAHRAIPRAPSGHRCSHGPVCSWLSTDLALVQGEHGEALERLSRKSGTDPAA